MPTANDTNIVLTRQSDGWWVAQIPVIDGCQALMPTRDEALDELQFVFEMIADEFQARGEALRDLNVADFSAANAGLIENLKASAELANRERQRPAKL